MQKWQIAAIGGGLLWIIIGAATGHTSYPQQIAVWLEKAQRYQIIHVLALLWLTIQPHTHHVVAALWTFGVCLFSGSLYLLALYGLPLNYIVPVGGVALVAGWMWLFIEKIRYGITNSK